MITMKPIFKQVVDEVLFLPVLPAAYEHIKLMTNSHIAVTKYVIYYFDKRLPKSCPSGNSVPTSRNYQSHKLLLAVSSAFGFLIWTTHLYNVKFTA
jgi:hypothetical protein